jgi:DNA-directed RNA polymerase specialized sigma24 family protein
MSWRKVRRHPAPRAWVVRTALNTGASWWRRRHGERLTASGCSTADPVQLGRDRFASAVDFRYCAGSPPDCRRGRLSV